MKKTSKAIVGALFVCISHFSLGQCDAVFKYGIYDFSDRSGQGASASSFVNWVCQHDRDDQMGPSFQADSFFGLEGSATVNGGSRTTVHELCQSQAGQQMMQNMYSEHSETIEGKVFETFTKCKQSLGVHAFLTTTADSAKLRLSITLNPDSKNETVAVQSLEPDGVCTRPPATIDVAGWNGLCTRPSGVAAVVLALNLDHRIAGDVNGQAQLEAPALPKDNGQVFSLRDYMERGNTVYFKTSANLRGTPAGCLGTIQPNSLYAIRFQESDISWFAAGPQGDGKTCGQNVNPDFLTNHYSCANNPEECDKANQPARGGFILFGAGFKFDSRGYVTHEDSPAGILLVSP